MHSHTPLVFRYSAICIANGSFGTALNKKPSYAQEENISFATPNSFWTPDKESSSTKPAQIKHCRAALSGILISLPTMRLVAIGNVNRKTRAKLKKSRYTTKLLQLEVLRLTSAAAKARSEPPSPLRLEILPNTSKFEDANRIEQRKIKKTWFNNPGKRKIRNLLAGSYLMLLSVRSLPDIMNAHAKEISQAIACKDPTQFAADKSWVFSLGRKYERGMRVAQDYLSVISFVVHSGAYEFKY